MSFPKMYRTLLVASVLLALAACNQSPADNASQTAPPSAATSPALASLSGVNASPLSDAELGAATSLPGHCALDGINGAGFTNGESQATVKAGSVFTARGWVLDGAKASPAKFTLVLKGRANSFGFVTATGVSRPDVAKAMGADAAVRSGYGVSANLGTTPNGTYKVEALIKGSNGMELCDNQRELVIGE